MRFLNIWLLTLVTILTNAEERSPCREPIVFKNFDMPRILGLWYVYSQHDHKFEKGCDCFTSVIVGIDEHSMQVKNCCQMTQVSNVTQNCAVGITKVTLVEPAAKEAYLRYIRVGSTTESYVWLIDTDYDNYVIGNGCDRVRDGEEGMEIFWILTREKEIKEPERKKINDILQMHKFDKKKIKKQKHGPEVCKTQRPNQLVVHDLEEPH